MPGRDPSPGSGTGTRSVSKGRCSAQGSAPAVHFHLERDVLEGPKGDEVLAENVLSNDSHERIDSLPFAHTLHLVPVATSSGWDYSA